MFDEAGLVQLGRSTAVQVGVILVDRSRAARTGGPIAMLGAALGTEVRASA